MRIGSLFFDMLYNYMYAMQRPKYKSATSSKIKPAENSLMASLGALR